MTTHIPVSIGELWDKYTILLIKKEKIVDKEKLGFVNVELTYLDEFIKNYTYMDNPLFCELKHINNKLWDIEDRLRIKEKNIIWIILNIFLTILKIKKVYPTM